MEGQPPAASSNAGRPQRGSVAGSSAIDPARQLPAYQPLVTVTLAVAAGIVLDRYARLEHIALPGLGYWLGAACFLIAWLIVWRRGWEVLAAGPLLMAAALIGASWHHLHWHVFATDHVGRYGHYDSGPVCLEAVARESPGRVPAPHPTPLRAIPGTDRSRLTVRVTGIRDGTTWRPASGRCQLTVEGHLLGVRPGDRLQIFGQLTRPAPPRNPGEFDFEARARADRQPARLRSSAPESVTILDRPAMWQPASVVDSVRIGGMRSIHDFVGPERAALASAILLGMRDDMPTEETASFFVTGTIHLLVVSGLHVGILAAGLYVLMSLGWLPRRSALAVIIAVVVVYALIAQARPPVVRGATLTVLVCLAAWTGRRGVAFNSLAAALLIVLAMNPSELFQAGTQLSFLAVATLIVVHHAWIGWRGESDPLDQLLQAARPWYQRLARWAGSWLFWFVLATAAVWLTALPLVLYRFHVAAPIAVAIQPFVWVLVVAALWSGFLMLLLSPLAPGLAAVCGTACNGSLAGLEAIVQWAEAQPVGHFWDPGPAGWWVAGFYAGLLAAMIYGRALTPRRWQVAALAAWILLGLSVSAMRSAARDGLECGFIAVGHGTCVVLEAPDGQVLLYDAGALGAPEYVTQSIASYLWHRGIRRIDGIVLSHADLDHFNAVPGLLARFRVGAVYVSPVMFDGFDDAPGGGPQFLRDAIKRAGVPIRQIWSGDVLRVGDEVSIHVLHPPRRGVIGSNNANSITLAVEYGGRRLLLPGDLESPGLDDLLAEMPLASDVVMAPHHGSRFSDPPGFAAWCMPRWVVISGGPGEQVRPVVEAYERAGAIVLRTHEWGAVRFAFREAGERVHVATWLNSP